MTFVDCVSAAYPYVAVVWSVIGILISFKFLEEKNYADLFALIALSAIIWPFVVIFLVSIAFVFVLYIIGKLIQKMWFWKTSSKHKE